MPAPRRKSFVPAPVALAVPAEFAYAGLDLLPSAVLLADEKFCVVHANSAAENLFQLSLKNLSGKRIGQLLPGAGLAQMLIDVVEQEWSHRTCEVEAGPPGRDPVLLACVVTPAHRAPVRVLLELHVIDQPLRVAREERVQEQSEANRQLIRNLAHEIKNPLGGIRGSAQLLERELTDAGNSAAYELREYTQVIVKEADRLQALMDRLLTPHRRPKMDHINIHEVLERVRTLVLAEFPQHIQVQRDYDTSLPELYADLEPLIQALLNIARNAAQAMQGGGAIKLMTRIARQVTLAKQRYRHAIMIHIIDNGPGVPENLRDKVFYPLVSGREGGTGLGLSLAQNFINQHHGIIEFDSVPGRTCFTILLPIIDVSTTVHSSK